jgi:hypothetical protein
MENKMNQLTDKFIEEIKNLNITILQTVLDRGEDFIAKAHIFGEDQDYVVMTPFASDEEKFSMLNEVGKLSYENKAHQVIFVSDSYLRHYNKEEDFKTAVDNWDTERPSLYPDSMRTAAILMYILDFKDSKNEKLFIYPYRIENKKVIMLDEMKDLYESSSYNGLIKSSIIEGFVREVLVDFLKKKEIVLENYTKGRNMEELKDIMSEFMIELQNEYPNLKPTNLT